MVPYDITSVGMTVLITCGFALLLQLLGSEGDAVDNHEDAPIIDVHGIAHVFIPGVP